MSRPSQKGGMRPSAPSISSAGPPKPNSSNDFSSKGCGRLANHADGRACVGPDTVRRTVCTKPLNNNDKTAADGADANFPDPSGRKKRSCSGLRAACPICPVGARPGISPHCRRTLLDDLASRACRNSTAYACSSVKTPAVTRRPERSEAVPDPVQQTASTEEVTLDTENPHTRG